MQVGGGRCSGDAGGRPCVSARPGVMKSGSQSSPFALFFKTKILQQKENAEKTEVTQSVGCGLA